MASNKTFIKILETINKKIEDLKSHEECVLNDFIDSNHPIKIGDRVVANYGYSHIGKDMIVTTIDVKFGYTEDNYNDRWLWTARGLILKKNGKPGERVGKWATDVRCE